MGGQSADPIDATVQASQQAFSEASAIERHSSPSQRLLPQGRPHQSSVMRTPGRERQNCWPVSIGARRESHTPSAGSSTGSHLLAVSLSCTQVFSPVFARIWRPRTPGFEPDSCSPATNLGMLVGKTDAECTKVNRDRPGSEPEPTKGEPQSTRRRTECGANATNIRCPLPTSRRRRASKTSPSRREGARVSRPGRATPSS